MQAIVETLFDTCYLIGVVVLGIIMIVKSQGKKQYRLFGIMAVVLGLGDAFHLIPRAVALCTTGLENYTFALGTGKFITSITMTVFYIILYYIWRIRYQIQGKKGYTISVYALAALRIVLCLVPQNAWTSSDSPLSWGIYRNIPFKNMWLTIVISFAFYLPVVLLADKIPMIGMLMIPKTLAYVWTVWIGYQAMKRESESLSK